MQTISEVNSPAITTAEFVKLTIYNTYGNPSDTSVYTFSSAYKSETINGVVYQPLGGLLAIGAQPKDLKVTSADTSIALAGVGTNNISLVLSANVKGSEIQILRGFYNSNMVLGNVYPRFTGIVTSYSISESLNLGLSEPFGNFVVTVNASSYRQVLENRMAGRKTTRSSWQVYSPTDSSMNNVASLVDQQFDFGKDPTTLSGVGQGGGGGWDYSSPDQGLVRY